MKPIAWVLAGVLVAGVAAWWVGREHLDPVPSGSGLGQTSANVADAGARQFSLETPIEAREPDELGTRSVARREQRDAAHIRLHGHVRDQNDEPIVGREIWLVEAKRGANVTAWHSFELPLGWRIVGRTISGAEGDYAMEGPFVGNWWIGIAPRAEAVPADDIYRPARAVQLAVLDSDREVDLIGYRGLAVQGTVSTPEGEPAIGAIVTAGLTEDGPEFALSRVDETGSFSVGPLASGSYLIRATFEKKFLPSETLRAAAGTTGLHLELAHGGHLVVSCVNDLTGNPVVASFRLVERDAYVDGSPTWEIQDDEADTIEIRGLYEGTYDVIAQTEAGGLGIARGLAVAEGGQAREVVIRVRPWSSLVVVCASSPKTLLVELYSGETFVDSEYMDAGEKKQFHVPPGPVRIRTEVIDFQAPPNSVPDTYWTAPGVRLLDVVAVDYEERTVEVSSR